MCELYVRRFEGRLHVNSFIFDILVLWFDFYFYKRRIGFMYVSLLWAEAEFCSTFGVNFKCLGKSRRMIKNGKEHVFIIGSSVLMSICHIGIAELLLFISKHCKETYLRTQRGHCGSVQAMK